MLCRTLCAVDTALLIVRNADKRQLLETGNFVVTDPSIIQIVQNGMWQLQCACPQRTKNQDWPKVREHHELRFERTRVPDTTMMLSVNGFELSESWPGRIDEYQLQSVKRKEMTGEATSVYISLWNDLIVEEKTRQRVSKGEDYTFEKDGLNLPWPFDAEQGYKTLPITIWAKKIRGDAQVSSAGWGSAAAAWHGPAAGQAWSDAWHGGGHSAGSWWR